MHTNALTLLLLQIASILVVSRVLGLVTRWLGQPLVIAEVLAGIVLGPSLLGLFWPEAMSTLFPDSSLPVLKMLSEIGLLLFMFLIGLELDPKLLRGRTGASIGIGLASIVVPFALSAAVAPFLSAYKPDQTPFFTYLLFLGVALSITAFPVLARILSERQLMATRVGAIAITCAAANDVAAWCLLAFVVGVAQAAAGAAALWTTGLALAFIAAMLFLVRPFLHRLGARVGSQEGLTPGVVAVALLGLLVSSAATEVIGIHALFGAFLFGACVPKEGRLAEALASKLETVPVVLFLPLFFASSGLRTEVGLLDTPTEWVVTAVIILVATVGKFGGSVVAGRLTGLPWREASAVGILMNTRGLMELIVLNIGLDLGVISPTMFAMLVLMALVTTFATSPVLRWIYPDRFFRGVEVPTTSPFTVLMCVSDRTSGRGLAAVSAALGVARRVALHLRPPTDRPSAERPREEAGPLTQLVDRAGELGVEVTPIEFASADPAADICGTATTQKADLLLIGWHKPLLLEGRLGGKVHDIVSAAPCPVGVLVDRGLVEVRRILVAFAGSDADRAALELARRLGQRAGVELTILHVVAPGHAEQPGSGRAQVTEIFTDPELAMPMRFSVVEHDSPPDAVLAASAGFDLLLVGMGARWGLETGGLSLRRERLLLEAPISILAVHPAAQGAG